jgi:hypothetical protein
VKLVVDARDELAGQAGLHALIVGVSGYRHLPAPKQAPTQAQLELGLGLEQLTAAARTGFLVYQWLLESAPSLSLPLATCRLLLVPAAADLAVAELADSASDALLDTFLTAAADWRADAAENPESITFFYFAGHGLQRERGDHVLLLENFADGVGGSKLKNAVDTFSLVQGMAPSKKYPRIARRQLYFFDACRMPLSDSAQLEEERCAAVFDRPKIAKDDRVAPEYYTALPGMTAFAIPGAQTTFSKALLECLRGAAAEEVNDRWCVTLESLNRALGERLGAVVKEYEEKQMFRLDGWSENVILRYLDEPPDVDVEFEFVPDAAAPSAEVTVNDLQRPAVTYGPPLHPHPFPASLRAGDYVVSARVAEGGRTVKPEIRRADPLRRRKWVFEV